MVPLLPLLPDSSWEFDDTFASSEAAGPLVFSTNVTREAFSVKRLPGVTDHSRPHDYVWIRVISKAPSYFSTFLVRKMPLRMSMTLK